MSLSIAEEVTSSGMLLLSNGEYMSRNVKCSCCLIRLKLLNDAYVASVSADDSRLNLHCTTTKALLMYICHWCCVLYNAWTVRTDWELYPQCERMACFLFWCLWQATLETELVIIITCGLFGYVIFFMNFRKYRSFFHFDPWWCMCSLQW